MKPIITSQLRYWFSPVSLWLAYWWTLPTTMSLVRWMYQIQISAEQMALIVNTIKAHMGGCRFLVFGLGNDSQVWQYMNRRGVTVFLEDSPEWFATVTAKHPNLTAYLVNYGTQLTEWQTRLNEPALLQMPFPPQVEQSEWDVILVDAPAGRAPQYPGRMKSIFASARLITRGSFDWVTDRHTGGSIFVHDCERQVEAAYCDRWLGPTHMLAEVRATEGWLRHYRL